MCDTPEYNSWMGMKARCDNPKSSEYKTHGDRGVRYCDRWKKFENFLEDMGRKPSARHSIDRKENNGNYEPGNCRWATPQEQANNTRSNLMITISGKTDTLANWCRLYAKPYALVRDRIRNLGWEPLHALTTPARKNVRKYD
jgi:hypothetical protein